jgi:hypothetical protein
MPAVGGGGRGNAGKSTPAARRKARRAAPKPYSPPATSRPDAAQRVGANTPTPQRRRPSTPVRPQTKTPVQRPAVAPSPGGDAATGGRNQMRKAERFKKTRAYRDTVKAVYDSLSSDQKLRLLDKINPTSVEGRILKRLHSERDRNAAQSGRGDAPYTNAERYQVELFKAGAVPHPNGRGVQYTGDTTYQDAIEAAKRSAAREFVKQHGKAAVKVTEKDPYKLEAAGFAAPGIVDKLMAAPLALPISGATGAAATAVAAYHDPIGVPKKTAGQLKDITLALPSAVAEMARHPLKTAEASVDDVSARAGQSFSEKVDRIRKEGAAADISDALIFVPAAGAAAKPATAAAIKLGLPGAPKAMPRRALRVESGGRIVAPREGGFIRLATGQAKDKRRARAQEASVRRAEAGGKPVDALVAEAVRLNREAGEVVAVAQSRLVRNAKLRRGVAKARARGVYGLKRELNLRTEKVRKLVNRLDKPEKRAFYYAAVYGIRTPAQGERILARLRTNIVEARERDGWEPQGTEKKADMLPEIDAILANPEGHFTERLAATVEAITPDSLRAGREDPRLELRQANLRRHQPLADVLGLERGVLEDRRSTARSGDVSIESRRVDVDEFEQAYRQAAEGERGDYLTDYTPEERQTHTLLLSPDGKAGAAVKPDGDIVNVFRLPGAKKGSGAAMVREAIRHGGFKLDATGSKLRDLYASLGFKVERTEKWDPAYGEPPTPDSDIYYMRLPAPPSEARRRTADAVHPALPLIEAQVAGALGEVPVPALRMVDESADDYLARVRRAVSDERLARPLYFRSERYAEEPGYGDNVVGGKGRMAEDSAYTGANLAIGLQDTGIDVYLKGLTRNIKAKHNKRLVDDLLMEHVIAKYDTGAYTLRQLRDALRRDGVAENSVKFWNPGIYRTQLRALRDDDMDVDLRDPDAFADENLEAFRASTAPGAGDTPGWKVIPAAAYRELEAEMTPSMAPGRAYDIGKGWMSKLILLTGNVPWLGAQIIQNMLAGGAATGGRALLPHNWIGAHKAWAKLTDDEREEIGSWLGLDATAADASARRMGGHSGAVTKAWHTLHDWAGWHKGVAKGRGPSVADFNPVQAMARMDRAQNNAARIVVWHTLEKSEKVKRLTADAGPLYKAQARIMRKLDGPNGEARLVRDRELLEQYGRHVEKFMGDFASLTAFERKFIGRAVMFYPFVRFATRLALYTLPVEHPMVGGIVAQVGRLQAEELQEIYGEDELRWFGGKVPVGDGKTIDLTKLNPVGAPWITALGEDRPAALLGVTPPFVGALYNQLSDKDYFTGSAQHYGEDPSLAYKQGFGSLPLISGTRARAAFGDVANLSLAYRALREMDINPAKGFREDPALEEYQGVDSLIVDPRPVEFSGKTADSKAKQKIYSAREQRREERDSWLAQFIPFLPESEDAALRQREDAKLEKIDEPAPERKKSKGYGFGGSGGYKFGG